MSNRCRPRPFVGGIAGLLLSATATAASMLESTQFDFNGPQYHYRFSARIAAPAAAVRAVVNDVDQLAQTNDSIRLSRVLSRDADGSWVRQLRLRQCVLVFCFDIDFVERVREDPNGDLRTTVLPGRGNFRQGEAVWQITPLADGSTRMVMEARQEPDFWIPPVLGPLIMKRTFTHEVEETIVNIERLARAHAVLR